MIGHDAQEATQRVENEGAEVGGEGDREQRVGQCRKLIVREIAEVGEDAVRQGSDGGVAGCTGIAKGERNGNDTDDGRDDSQGPDGFARRQRSSVQDAEVLRSLIILTHGVGNTGAGVHAAQRGADEREEDREGLSKHEVFAVALAQQVRRRR